MGATSSVKTTTAAAQAVRAKRVSATRIRQRPDLAHVDPRELARRRKKNREYMRLWRVSAENRETEKRRSAGQYLRRKMKAVVERRNGLGNRRYAYCHQESVMMIDRLRATEHDFKKVEFPYCGHC